MIREGLKEQTRVIDPLLPGLVHIRGVGLFKKFGDQEEINLTYKEKSFKISSNKKLNIVNKKLTLSNYHSADGAVRLLESLALMALLGIKI